MSRAEDPDVRARVARSFWDLLEAAGGDGEDFRAEGLEWTYSWHPDYCDGEELFREVGRWHGRYDGLGWLPRPELRAARLGERAVAVPLVQVRPPCQTL